MSKVGAPKGGRVHWFLYNLSPEITRCYTVRFDYAFHNYLLIRYPERDERRKPIDLFVIIRTSRRCFRGMYYNFERNLFEYFSGATSKEVATKVYKIYARICAA